MSAVNLMVGRCEFACSMKVQCRVYLCPTMKTCRVNVVFPNCRFKDAFAQDFSFNLCQEYVGKGNSHFRSHSCPMNLKILLSIELERISLQNQSKHVSTCQRSVGPFDDDCERLYSMMVKTNKRSGDQVNSGRILLNALDHYNIVREM